MITNRNWAEIASGILLITTVILRSAPAILRNATAILVISAATISMLGLILGLS